MKVGTTPPNAPPPAGSPSPTASSPGAAALIADAKLQATVSSGTTLVPEPSRDGFEQVRRTDHAANDADTKRSGDANPFCALDRADARDRERLGDGVDLDTPVDTTPDQQARLSAFLAKHAFKNRDVPSKTLEGFMLLAHDGQASGARVNTGGQQQLTAYAQKLLSQQAGVEEHRAFWRQMSVNSQNVAALVQRVLRESYLISNEMMLEMATRLRHANELRKKIREELDRARVAKTACNEESRGDENWVSDDPYGALEVNRDAFELEPDTLDADELARHKEALAARGEASGKADIMAAIEALNGESRLSAKDRFQLDQLLRGNDDVIKDNMDLIKSILGSLNADDIRHYIEPFFDKLNGGNTDEDQIKDLFASMSPPQYLTAIADGYTASHFGFHAGDANDFRNLTVTPLYDYIDTEQLSANTGLSVDEIMKHGALGLIGAWLGANAGFVGGGPGIVAGTVVGAAVTGNAKAVFGGALGNLVAGPIGSVVGSIVGSIAANPMKEAHTEQLTPEIARKLLEVSAQPADSTTGLDERAQPASDGATLGSQHVLSTVKELEDYIKGMEDELNSVGEDAQLMNVDLQNQLQRAQNTMQMMSNLSKVMHDTAMAVIRNTNR
jgi:hypothetical protein